MSAAYTRVQWTALRNKWYDPVTQYIESNPGTSVDAITTALSAPYAVVYAICVEAHVVMPSAAGEITWRGDEHG